MVWFLALNDWIEALIRLSVLPALFQVNDTQGLRAAKINPREVGRVVDDAFAEMTFIHGFIHADPHPGAHGLLSLVQGFRF
jgi:hypothetical protein